MPQKDLVGSIIQKFPQKLNAQRTSKGPISISECCVDGEFIIIENTSKRNDVNMTNWLLTHCVGSVRKVSFKFPENFLLKSKQSAKLWASSRNSGNKSGKPSYSSSSSLSSSSSSLSSSSKSKEQSATNGFYLSGSLNGQEKVNGDMPSIDHIENELILYDIENWTCGSQEMFIRIENEFGEEKACFRKTN